MAEVWVDFIPSPSAGLKALTCIDYLIRLGWFCLWPWYWIFKVKWIWFALFQEKKWTDYHETKKERIDWALDLKYIHHYLLWSCMTLTSNFQGQILDLLYLRKKMVRLPGNVKQIINWIRAIKVALTFDLQFSRWNVYSMGHISGKMVRSPQNEKLTYQFNARPWLWP